MSNNFTPLQAQNFSLAGSGCVIGDTTIVLKSMTTIDGALITMSMLGLYAFMTLEPGNGSNEEQIVFTGITQNANGTATLTGVSNVSMGTPYTQTSGVLKTHAGSVTAILSNTSGFYNSFVAKDDDGTISETLTFTTPNFPQMNGVGTRPSLPAQLVTKSYADSLTFAGAPNASTSVQGLVQVATQAQVDAKTLIGSTSAYLILPLNTQRSTLLSDYVLDTSPSANVIVITPSPAISAYATGQQFSFKLANTNTSAVVTLNVNAIGAKPLTSLNGSTSPGVSSLVAGQMIVVQYDGTNFQVESPLATTVAPAGTPSNGDMLYVGSSAWTRLAAGTSPYVLTSGGAGAAPSWKAIPTATTTNNGTGTVSTATTVTIAHGLGRVPVLLNLWCGVNTGTAISWGTYNGTTQNQINFTSGPGFGAMDISANSLGAGYIGYAGESGNNYMSFQASWDATNIYLATGTSAGYTGTTIYLWQVQ